MHIPESDISLVRNKILFNFDWKFHRHDIDGADQPGFDDSSWRSVDLPHDYSIEGDFELSMPHGRTNGFRPLGVGWYRKSFSLPGLQPARRVLVLFEGVYNCADVWINGMPLERQYNGYVSFWRDLTNYIIPGKANVLAVRSDNKSVGSSRWYTGSGIYRNVHLLIVDALHVPVWGVGIHTPRVSRQLAEVAVETRVHNTSGSPLSFQLRMKIFNPENVRVADFEITQALKAGETKTVECLVEVASPALWSDRSPVLYTALTTLWSDGQIRDRVDTTFGIREIRLTPDRGLLLNGEKLFLKGLCLHHDLGCLGSASFDRAWERRLRIIRAMGCNAVRLSHNPFSPGLLDLCDRMGILVFHEHFDMWGWHFSGERVPFEQTWKGDLRETILRDRNHPSIFVWGVGNEVREQLGEGKGATDFGAAFAREIIAHTKTLDPTRPVTISLYPARAGAVLDKDPEYQNLPPAEIAFLTDLSCFNYQEIYFDRDHVLHPEMIFCASECSTGIGARAFASFRHDYAVGLFYWGAIEYLGEVPLSLPGGKSWPFGIFDLTCHPKGPYFPIAAAYADQPVVFLAIAGKADTGLRHNDVQLNAVNFHAFWSGTPGEPKKVCVFSNCAEVELFLNGNSLGTRRDPDGRPPTFVWHLPYETGVLEAIGRPIEGGEVRTSLHTPGTATRLELLPDRARPVADGLDLVHIEVRAVDSEGIVVPDANHRVRFTVVGAAGIAGVDNGDNTSDEAFQAPERSLFRGRALLVLRTGRVPGEVKVRAEAEKLACGELELVAVGKA